MAAKSGIVRMNERNGEKGLVGLPPNLLIKDANGSPRVFSLMPGFNRSERRGLATRMRSMGSARSRKIRTNDTDTILERYQDPTFRRMAFWHELRTGAPAADEYSPSQFITVDYWLLRDFDAHLDLLTPPTDVEMVECCPHWPELSASLQETVKAAKGKLDVRYFALWPRILDVVADWDGLSEEMRVKAVNGAFALSSISGDPWFVEELQRRCSGRRAVFRRPGRQGPAERRGQQRQRARLND